MAAKALGRPLKSLPAPGEAGTVFLEGGAGRIEALVAVPVSDPAGAAVVCHPHPLHGGALTNKVAYALANAALKQGLVAVRFNFRGVGKSEGVHDEGRGEADDTVAVATWARARLPGQPLLLAGFSFGAFVSLVAAARVRPDLLVSVAPPFRYFAKQPLPPRPPAPWLVVHARDDDVVDFDDTMKALQQYTPAPTVEVLQQGGHFFHGRIAELQSVCSGFIKQHWPG